MKNHPTQEQWMEYLYGEMDSAARNSRETHVKGCAPCRETQGELCGTMESLDAWRVEVPEKHSLAATRNRFQPVVKWAAAAALLVTTGFAAARFAQPQVDVAALKAEISAEVKSEVQAPLDVKVDQALAAAAEQAVAVTREQMKLEMAAQLQEVTLRARSDALLAVQAEVEELQLRLAAVREDERKTLNTALKKVELQWLAQLRTIREDLERVAVFSDESHRSAQRQLVQLAGYTQPNIDTTEQEN
ncbi:MAG: hypothetical protein ACXW32_11445 [Limisphaerales bacterium]